MTVQPDWLDDSRNPAITGAVEPSGPSVVDELAAALRDYTDHAGETVKKLPRYENAIRALDRYERENARCGGNR